MKRFVCWLCGAVLDVELVDREMSDRKEPVGGGGGGGDGQR